MQRQRQNEQGGARLKFLMVMTVIAAAGYVAYLYIPVAYQAHTYKDLMQHYADVAGSQGYKPEWAGEQLAKSAAEYDVPADAIITPAQSDNRIEIRVQFTRPIEFPGYTYDYEFDQTVKSTAFLTFK
jgi:hypothetical protein